MIHRLFLLLLIAGAFLSCSEVVDLDIDQSGGDLIISGRVSTSTEGNYVSIHRTGGSGQSQSPVKGAAVSVTDGRGATSLLVEGDSGYYYFRERAFRGAIGESYALRVVIGNEEYLTAPQVIPAPVGFDDLTWQTTTSEQISDAGLRIEQEVVEVYATTTFNELPDEFYLRWVMEEAYTYLGTYLPGSHFPPGGQVQCYVERGLTDQRMILHNGSVNRTTQINERLFASRLVDKSFQAKHYFNLIRFSISEDAHRYWSQIGEVVDRQGSIFDRPPAPVRGNVRSATGEQLLGFFEVSAVDTTRLLLTNNDVPYFFFNECEKIGPAFSELFTVPRGCVECLIDRGIVAPQCIDCLRESGGSYDRPAYF